MDLSLLVVDTKEPWFLPHWRVRRPTAQTDTAATPGIRRSELVKVLLVEDERRVAASLKVGLRAEGFAVHR
jgi:hypothetical protein